MSVADRLTAIRHRMDRAARGVARAPTDVTLIAVSKTFEVDDIRPVIAAGLRVFGENRVQEAKAKWPLLRAETPDVELHLIGPLQSNKAREAVQLFDAIHTIDRDKIAAEVAKEMRREGRALSLYIQVNTGLEPQKAGVDPREAVDFVTRCRSEHGLAPVGLMCIPPAEENPGPHFALLAKLADTCGVTQLSMGMSADFEIAIAMGATHVRVGSALFGHRS